MKNVRDFLADRPRSWLLFGGLGLFLCVASLVVSSFIIYQRSPQPTATNLALSEDTATPTSDLLTDVTPIFATVVISTETPTAATPTEVPVEEDGTPNSPTATPTSVLRPNFAEICFRAKTEQGSYATGCDTTFGGETTEISAIFDYDNMNVNRHEWTRIWYLNGQEVLRVRDKWTGDATGQFEYSLNTSDGGPLSPGNWELELYIGNQLETVSSFVIDEPAVVEAQATAPPRPPTTRINPAYQLAFTKWDGGKHSVWVANLDGSNQRWLLDFAASPSWSPDGSGLTFYGEEGIDNQEAVEAGTNGVWRMGPNGENPTQLVPEGTGQVVNWSPANNAIAFDAARGGTDRRIYFVDPNGSVLPFETLGQHPAFSPDGSQVVVKVCRPGCGLWISSLDGAAVTQLTSGGSDGLPVWSPDGRKIAFSRNVDGNVDIYLINVDGTGLQRLTNAVGNDSLPTWTPDGSQLAFRSTRNGLWQIFVMNADGSNQTLIIDNVGASGEWAFDRMSIR